MRSQRALIALRALSRPQRLTSQTSLPTSARHGYADHPIDELVDERLDKALKEVQTATVRADNDETRKAQRDEIVAKAQIVFGSKLVGPQRQAQLDAKSRLVAGVLIPPKPEEPDNCCMSGCVNCVWDMYRDEMEDWAAKSTEARARKEEQRSVLAKSTSNNMAVSMDDDGGGSESNWSDDGPVSGDMFEGIPIGIRAFMENEKRLKAKHRMESASNG